MFRLSASLANRLSYRAKFSVIGALVAAVVSVLLIQMIISAREQIAHTQSELLGLRYTGELRPLFLHLQQHRGLAAIVLNGDETKKSRPLPQKRRAQSRYQSDQCSGCSARRHDQDDRNLERASDKIASVTGRALTFDAPTSFREHTLLLTQLKDFLVEICRPVGPDARP